MRYYTFIYNILIIIDKGEQCGDDVAPFHDIISIAKPFLLVHCSICCQVLSPMLP